MTGPPPGNDPAPPPRADHPDYRYSLANERTFLAWVRTSLALLAAGVGAVALPSHFSSRVGRHILGLVLVVLGVLASSGSYLRWRANEAAVREGAPLPTSRGMPIIAAGLTGFAVLTLILVIADF